MNILNIEHVSKVFGEKTIFDDVSFGIQEGDKIGIIGINGTGKTTLLRMIAGVEEPDRMGFDWRIFRSILRFLRERLFFRMHLTELRRMTGR